MKNLVFVLCILVLVHCADVTTTTASNGSNTDVSATVATNTAAVNEIVTTDTLDELFVILNGIENDIDTNTGTDVGDRLTARLTAYADASDTNDLFTVTLSDEEDCTQGGTKTLTGQLDYNNDSSGSSGTIEGSFTISYADCQDTITLSPADQDCGATPTINGDMETVIDVSYGSLDTFETGTFDYFLSSETNSAGGLEITVGATASDQTYSYTYTLSDNTTDTDLSGTVEFDGQSYSVTEVSDFISSSTSAVVCAE